MRTKWEKTLYVFCQCAEASCVVHNSRLQVNFLINLVAIFPSLKNRPFYLTGESYAGTYIVRI
jgi:Serine carboxypeptidase